MAGEYAFVVKDLHPAGVPVKAHDDAQRHPETEDGHPTRGELVADQQQRGQEKARSVKERQEQPERIAGGE